LVIFRSIFAKQKEREKKERKKNVKKISARIRQLGDEKFSTSYSLISEEIEEEEEEVEAEAEEDLCAGFFSLPASPRWQSLQRPCSSIRENFAIFQNVR